MLRRFGLVLALSVSFFVGAARADLRSAAEAYQRGDAVAARDQLEPLAEQGNAEAQALLGVIYTNGGKGVPRDDRKAVEWLSRAAEQKDALAEALLGEAYADGRGVKADPKEAVEWFRRSADQGEAIAEYDLGRALAEGVGVKRDAAAAAEWEGKAAAQDFPPAEDLLARFNLRGFGVAVDEKQGLQWMRKAASHGYAVSEAGLGLLYAGGVGTRRDKVQAFKWLELALRELPPGKLRQQASETRNALDKELTEAQRSRAKAQLAKFEPVPIGGKKRAGRNALRPRGEPEVAGPIGTGSGFVVSAEGHIVTNDHVVAQCGSMRVRHLGPESIPAQVLARDSKNDLALLKIAGPPAKVAVLRSGVEIRPGDGVVAVGFPLTGILAEDANVTTGGVSAMAGIRNDQRYLQISAPVQPGNSGGPLLDMSGHVVGVVSSGLDAARMASAAGIVPQNVNFAIKIGVVRQFLDANHVPYRGEDSRAHLEAADVGEAAKTFTALVECWK